MKLLEYIIMQLLIKEKEGQRFFSALDKSIQHKNIIDKLLSITSANNYYIVSGGFGRFFKLYYPEKKILLLRGGIRHSNTFTLEPIAQQIKHKDFIFLDDSYYSGKTKNAIRNEIEKWKGNLKHSFVIYDGSQWKDREVTSLYRYHERF